MKIKVCGMRHIDNILALYEGGVRMMGFIFYPKSKRFIPQSERSELFAKVPADVKKVGVFVNEELDEVISLVQQYHLDYVQLHGEEGPNYVNEVSEHTKVLKAFRVDEEFDFSIVSPYKNVDHFLFDAKGKDYGGNGIQYDWTILERYNQMTPFILSGGIGPNDATRIKSFSHDRFMGIDINSGFEIEPALKDANKIEEFIKLL